MGATDRQAGESMTHHAAIHGGRRATAKHVCAKFAVPCLPDSRRIGENAFHRLVTEGEECPKRAAYIDALMARKKS